MQRRIKEDKHLFMEYGVLIYLYGCSIFDIKEKKIPAGLLYGGIICIFLYGLYSLFSRNQSLLQLFMSMIPAFCGMLLNKMGGGIGEADGFLLLIIGPVYGLMQVLSILTAALLLAGLYGIFLMLVTRCGRKTRMAFAPFLFLACAGVSCL